MLKITILSILLLAAIYGLHRFLLWAVTRTSRTWADKKDQEYEYWAYKRKDFFHRLKKGRHHK